MWAIQEAAQAIGVSVPLLYWHIRQGHILSGKANGRIYVDPEDLKRINWQSVRPFRHGALIRELERKH